jgi:tRNA(Ile)-lysidine synthase
VLYRLQRGAGTAGLAGIRPVTREGIVRPLIAVTRADIRKYLQGAGVSWREDESNQDLRLDRNRIRSVLLPELAREWNPSIEEVLSRTARVASAEESYWESEIGRLAAELFVDRAPAVLLPRSRLAQLPEAVQRRLIRAAMERVRGDLRRIDGAHVERTMDLARSGRGTGRVRVPGAEIVRSFDWIRVAPAPEAPSAGDYRIELSVPGEVELPAAGVRLSCELINLRSNGGYNESAGCELDWGRVSRSLEVRNSRPGDWFQPAGRPARKMKMWFQRERVPLWERPGWPMVTCSGTIVWTRKLGAAEGFAATAESASVLRISERHAGGGT